MNKDMRLKSKHIWVTIILLAVILTPINFINAQVTVGKEIKESFEIGNQTKLFIKNKYGNIDIVNHSTNKIDVLVQVKFYGLNDSQVQEILKYISIKNYTEGNKIFFETRFNDDFGSTINKYNKGDKKFEINYTVNMPPSVPVDLDNKYGSIFIEELESPSAISVKYGNLKAQSIASKNDQQMTAINLGYSDGSIDLCKWIKLNIKYSKLSIDKSKALVVVSKYSKLFIESGSSLVTESKYDTYHVGTISNFVSEAAYSNYKFKAINKKMQVETKYTDMRVDYMPHDFDEIVIETSYGNYHIGIHSDASYSLSGVARYGNISYPDKSHVNRFQKTVETRVDGYVGSNSNPKAKINIKASYGSVHLK